MRPSVTHATARILHGMERVTDALWRHHRHRPWACPGCDRNVALARAFGIDGTRRWARCPFCGALERHRLAVIAFDRVIAPAFAGRTPRVLHFAPEPMIATRLRQLGGTYETADLYLDGVDHRVDLVDLPFDSASFDLVWASHVLAIVRDDRKAIAEIRRILRPGGAAVLPVPVFNPVTIDYPRPVAGECDNWHGPGPDYFDRFREQFARARRLRLDRRPGRGSDLRFRGPNRLAVTRAPVPTADARPGASRKRPDLLGRLIRSSPGSGARQCFTFRISSPSVPSRTRPITFMTAGRRTSQRAVVSDWSMYGNESRDGHRQRMRSR